MSIEFAPEPRVAEPQVAAPQIAEPQIPEPQISVWNREMVPSVSRWLNVLRHPVGWLAVLGGFSLLVGLVVGQQGWPVLVMCLAVLLLGCLWPKLQVLAIAPELDFSHRSICEDDEFDVIVRMRNRFPLPIWGLKVQGLSQLCEEKTIGYVAPLSTSTFRWKSTAGMRGIYPKTDPSITTGFPFGLIECRLALPTKQSLFVVPRLTDSSIAVDCQSGTSLHESSKNKIAVNGNLRGLRPYRHGDMMKKCHWAQTARTDSLIVREDEIPKAEKLEIRLESAAFTDSASAELAFRASLSLVRQLQRQAMPVDLVLDGRCIRLEGSKREFEKLLIQLCSWQWAEPQLAAALPNTNPSNALQSSASQSGAHQFQPGRRSKSTSRSSVRPLVMPGRPANRSTSRRSITPYLPAALAKVATTTSSFVTFSSSSLEVAKSA